MIEQILETARQSRFDFRRYANPADPLQDHFEEWVPYYRLKHAIAAVLQPRSILEIGVRFGYSAVSFLDAAPDAAFVGIDLDIDTFGGQVGALEWAKRITSGRNAKFIVADTQQLARLPGGIYDLVHVDGQQDGAGTFHDLRRAVAQARWVLLDGYFWTPENFFNANDFLLKYDDVFEYAFVIPGYAGELLLRVKDAYVRRAATAPSTPGAQITEFHDANDGLNDYGGYGDFRRSRSQRVDASRLLSLLVLARMHHRGRPVLDLGCGRGEIAYQLAASGCSVTAVDHSPVAIELAKSCMRDASEEVLSRVNFICGGVGQLESEQKFGTVLASNLIEHLSPQELEKLYAFVARAVEPDGVFVIYTAPNLWRYKRDHPRRRRAVQQLGGYLAAEPRTRYELLLHVNEQSPARLRRFLRRFFRHVLVWVANPDSPAGNLARKYSLSELTAATDIYGLASAAPIDLNRVASLLQCEPLPAGEHAKFSVAVECWPSEAPVGGSICIRVRLTNTSRSYIASLPPAPVFVSYHWLRANGGMYVFDGVRSPIPLAISPTESGDVATQVKVPAEPGQYRLVLTLVQEGYCWFDQMPGFSPAQTVVNVI